MTVAVFTLAHQPGIELHVPFTRSSPGTICGRATYWYSRLDAGTTKSILASRVKGEKKFSPASLQETKKETMGRAREAPSFNGARNLSHGILLKEPNATGSLTC